MRTKILVLFLLIVCSMGNSLYAYKNTACNSKQPMTVCKLKCGQSQPAKVPEKPTACLTERDRIIQLLKKISDSHSQNKKVKVRLYLIVI